MWAGITSHEEARAFVQRRLALFAKLWLGLLPVFVVSVIGFYRLYPELRPSRSPFVQTVALATLVPLVIVWYVALLRRTLTLPTLYAIDALNLVGIGALFGLSAYASSELKVAMFTTFIWQTFVVVGRVFIVPSSPARTALVTTASYLPLVAAMILVAEQHPLRLLLPAPAFVGGGVLFIAAAIAVATAGSAVIYGLQRQVEAATWIGIYALETKIGQGGMGEVWRARHAMLRRPTAIKLLLPRKVTPDGQARFEREVQHMSRLTHPNTVAVFDYGRSVDGRLYYAMELLDGVDLQTIVDRDGAMPAARVVRVLVQICGSLTEAHDLGLVHRDIKPANVMLCRRGGMHDVVKVVDFGIAQEIESAGARPGLITGTPGYVAPEVITHGGVGPASDLYGVGALAYFLLTGARVFDGDAMDQLVAHASATPAAPSTRTGAPIPAALEQLVLACLEKDPARRPASARALGDALEDLARAHPWSAAEAEAWWRGYEARQRPVDPTAATADAASMTVDLRERP